MGSSLGRLFDIDKSSPLPSTDAYLDDPFSGHQKASTVRLAQNPSVDGEQRASKKRRTEDPRSYITPVRYVVGEALFYFFIFLFVNQSPYQRDLEASSRAFFIFVRN
jgi:hypothetical protein